MNRNELEKEAIKKAHEEANAKKDKQTVKEVFEGKEIDTYYYRKGNAIWSRIAVDGHITSENMVYGANTEKPYTRGFGEKWYISGEYLEAMREAI